MTWYVAVLVMESEVDQPTAELPVVDHQVRVIEASDAEAAYERAHFIGRGLEHSYPNSDGRNVHWRFRGLFDLDEISIDDLRDGGEVYSVRLPADRALPVVGKHQLTIFWSRQQRDRSAEALLD